MRTETGTFELRDNDMMMRELTSAETSEVAGGTGTAEVVAATQSGPGSSISSGNSGAFTLATSNTSAFAAISGTFTAVGTNTVAMQSIAVVGPPF